jgi:hypothetical protein
MPDPPTGWSPLPSPFLGNLRPGARRFLLRFAATRRSLMTAGVVEGADSYFEIAARGDIHCKAVRSVTADVSGEVKFSVSALPRKRKAQVSEGAQQTARVGCARANFGLASLRSAHRRSVSTSQPSLTWAAGSIQITPGLRRSLRLARASFGIPPRDSLREPRGRSLALVTDPPSPSRRSRPAACRRRGPGGDSCARRPCRRRHAL